MIPNPNINTRQIGLQDIDYKLLMHNTMIKPKVQFNSRGVLVKDKSDPMIVKYFEINQQYGYKVKGKEDTSSRDTYTRPYLKSEVLYNKIAVDTREELSKFGYTDVEITDILVKVLYHIKDSRHKALLWFCYGEQIYNNLREHFTIPFKDRECIDCGIWFRVKSTNTVTNRCPHCYEIYRREYYRLNKQKQRAKNTNPNKKRNVCMD